MRQGLTFILDICPIGFMFFFVVFFPVCFCLSAQNMFALTDFSALLSIKHVA